VVTDHPHDEENCCRPPTETELDNNVVRSAADDVRRFTKYANCIEIALVFVAAVALCYVAVQNGINGNTNRKISEQNNELLRAQIAGQQFGLDAVNCLRYIIVEHRYVNQEYHDLLLEHLGITAISKPMEPDLPRRPSQAEIAKACAAFESNPSPPQVNTTTTTRGKG
jgi:hypothetical protein